MKIRLNMLNKVASRNVDRFHDVDINMFWDLYLGVTSITAKTKLAPLEKKLLIYILCNDSQISHFKGVARKKLLDYLKIKNPNLTKLKNILVEKGYLIETGEITGDVIINASLRSFQKFIMNSDRVGINFMFPINIVNNDSKTN